MAAPSLDVDWTAIRSAAESGVPLDKISARFGVKSETIRKKAQRHGWILLKDVLKDALKAQKLPLSQPGTKNVPEAKKEPPKVSKQAVVELVQESWAEKGESFRRMMAAKLEPLLKNAKLESPKNWKDMEIAAKIATKTLGLDTGETQVNVALVNQVAGFGGARDPDLSWLKGDSFEPSHFDDTKESPAAIEADGE